MQLKDFIVTYDNFLSDESCDKVISEFEKRQQFLEQHDTSGYKFEQLNLNQCGLDNVAEAIVANMVPYFEDYFSRLGLSDYVDVQGFEHVRIKKYYKNSDYQFKPHIDVTNFETAKRYVVAIIYLNDNDGITDFPQLNYSVKPKKGSVVLFPPTWQYLHSGNIPTDNDKYIMMTSLNYV